MTTQRIPGSDFFKSLGRLEALARGNQPQEEVSKAQLFHTPSDSERTSWPGGEKSEIGNKWDDSIGSDGTDYHPARKSIAEKALKGLPLTPDEIAILKGDIENSVAKGQFPFQKDDDKKEDEDDEKKEKKEHCAKAAPPQMAFKAHDSEEPAKEEKTEKSFSSAIRSNETIQKGIELSGFLAELVKSFGTGLQGIESRTTNLVEQSTNAILQQIGSYLDARFSEQGEFNKSLADAIVNIGHGLAGNLEQVHQIAQAPAGAPKSQLRAIPGGVQPVEKSFAGGQGEKLSKAQALDIMVDLVEKGQLNSLEVCKFETTGQMRPEVEAIIMQNAGGRK